MLQDKNDNFQDLYMMLSPGHDSLHIVRSDEGIEGMRAFTGRNIDRALQSPMVPDNWLLHYHLSDYALREIPQLSERSSRDYFRRLAPTLTEKIIAPENIVRLRDAVYCREVGIELLSPQAQYTALCTREDYMRKQNGYGAYIPELKGVLPDFKACNAVELDQGVLLFSSSTIGDRMLQGLMREIAGNFFDPAMDKASIHFYQLPLFDPTLKNYVDKYQPSVTNDEVLALLDKSVLRNGVCTGGFDLSPTPAAYWALTAADVFGNRRPDNEPRNREIASLLYVREHGRRPGEMEATNGWEKLMREEATAELALNYPGIRQSIDNRRQEVKRVPAVKMADKDRGIVS